jgi:hypothetical protein
MTATKKARADRPNVESMCAAGLRRVLDTGSTAAEVAAELMDEHWAVLPADERRSLATAGLAKLLNRAVEDERARQWEEEWEEKEEQEKKEEAAEEVRRQEERHRLKEERDAKSKELLARYYKDENARREREQRLRDDRQLQKDIIRLHELSGCPWHQEHPPQGPRWWRVRRFVECLGEQAYSLAHQGAFSSVRIGDVLAVPREELETAAKRLAEVYHIHREMKCRENHVLNSCVVGCVHQNVLSHPEEERRARIDRCRHVNEQAEADNMFFRIGMERGYRQAVADLKSVVLIAADGTMKALLHFDGDDLKMWAARSASNVASWAKRHGWFAGAAAVLAGCGAGSLADLPPDKVCELAASACAVWKEGDVAE